MAVPRITHRYTGVDYTPLINFTVNYKDVISMQYFYILLHEWLIDKGYATRDDTKFNEVFYLQKENPQTGKEIWIRWRLQKEPQTGGKLWRIDLDIDIHAMGLKEVEITNKGKKYKAEKGEVEITAACNIINDYEKAWEKDKWLKAYKKFITQKFYKKKREGLEAETFEEMEALQNTIKEYMQVEKQIGPQFAHFWKTKTPE